jgi:hypothetical protein
MSKRTIKVKTEFEIVIDDDSDSLPYIRHPSDLIFHGARVISGLVEVKPGAKVDMRFTRDSWNELRRRDRARGIK